MSLGLNGCTRAVTSIDLSRLQKIVQIGDIHRDLKIYIVDFLDRFIKIVLKLINSGETILPSVQQGLNVRYCLFRLLTP
jgi:hypothetical protein